MKKTKRGLFFYETPCRKWHTPCQIRWKLLTLDDLKGLFARFQQKTGHIFETVIDRA